MNSNEFENLINQSGTIAVKQDNTMSIYLDEYISRNGKCFERHAKNYIQNGENITEIVHIHRKFHCGHISNGEKNFGMEIFEKPHNKAFHDIFKNQGFIIVCSACVRECSACGTATSTISGVKIENNWHCQQCADAIAFSAFVQRVKNFFKDRSNWW
ncbi:MAG: hypothetical protein EOM23_00335 [Candidatus Moranbacteria bacterium]|nr:hypothetical protein [Candidatus Moranbacteria bacterium]